MKKKILFVTQALWIGGIETALVNLINHLNHEKYEITCLITEDYQNMVPYLTYKCRLIVADRQHTVSFSEPYKYSKLFNLMEEPHQASKLRRAVWKAICLLCRGVEMHLYARYIKKQLREEHFDTVVIYSDRVAEIAVKATNADRFLMFYHNADIGKAYHDIYGYCVCDKIIAVSNSQCEKLKKRRPIFAHKMIVIQNYIDIETVRKKALEPIDALLPEDGIHLISCGRLAHQKGFDIAVKACANIVRHGYHNLHWYILGTGPMKKELTKLIHDYGIENHFHLIGTRVNPFPYMKAADLYIQPSRTEGYSLSILEARVLACPIISTYAAAGEQLIDGRTGTLCGTSADSLADAILKHLKNPKLSECYTSELMQHSFENQNTEIINKIESLL